MDVTILLSILCPLTNFISFNENRIIWPKKKKKKICGEGRGCNFQNNYNKFLKAIEFLRGLWMVYISLFLLLYIKFTLRFYKAR